MTSPRSKRSLVLVAVLPVALLAGSPQELLATCGPFTDVPDGNGFCSSILEIYTLAITLGTSATTYSPTANVTREQMAAFLARTYDRAALRTSRQAALDQWWTTTPHYDQDLGVTAVTDPAFLKSDGADVWVSAGNTVVRVRASDGKLLDTWTSAFSAKGVLVAMGRVFVTGSLFPGRLYMIDPAAPAGDVTTVTTSLGDFAYSLAFDGNKIWTTNNASGSVSIVTPGTWSVTTVSAGLVTPAGIVFDGKNIWITDQGDNNLKKLNSDGSVAQTVAVGSFPWFPAFDGNNIWVPSSNDDSLTVVRASDGAVIKTFSAANGNQNGLDFPFQAAFDGQRVLVTSELSGGRVSLFKAADLSAIGFFQTSSAPGGVCSDGLNFWITLSAIDKIARY